MVLVLVVVVVRKNIAVVVVVAAAVVTIAVTVSTTSVSRPPTNETIHPPVFSYYYYHTLYIQQSRDTDEVLLLWFVAATYCLIRDYYALRYQELKDEFVYIYHTKNYTLLYNVINCTNFGRVIYESYGGFKTRNFRHTIRIYFF